jgi:hypothetical protein
MTIYFRLSYNLREFFFLIPQNHDMGDFAFFSLIFVIMKCPPNFHMVLKWFKGLHFELQTKVQNFEESI